ncbi:hypothetical protein [Rhodoferax antarcticus]|nr:hypothetical protein [Rhodoferax antarcticus]
MTFTKLVNFSSLAVCSAIEPFLKKASINAKILDTAFDDSNSVYLARLISEEYCDEGSEEAMQVTTYRKRSEEDYAVYISPRRNSIFNGSTDDAVALFKDGMKVYPVEEYQHGDTNIRLVGDAIRSAKAILTGSFREGVNLSCRWDSSFAFFAIPKSWKKPGTQFFEEFSNWLNGVSYSLEVVKATANGVNEDGKTRFSIEQLEQCYGFYSTECAESDAIMTLESICKQAETSLA